MKQPPHKGNHTSRPYGFTLMELMVVIAIIAILATLTMPSLLAKRQRAEVAEAVRMAKSIRNEVTQYYEIHHSFPSDNNEAGVPAPEQLIGNKVSRIDVEQGAIHITLGNKAAKPLQGKVVSMRPAVVTGSPASPISWLCGPDEPVQGMEAIGEDKTDISIGFVPSNCGN